MSEKATLQLVGEHLGKALQPLAVATSDPDAFAALMMRLGWDADEVTADFAALGGEVLSVAIKLSELGEEPDAADVLDLVVRVRAVYVRVQELESAPPGVDPTLFLAEIKERLFDVLLLDYLVSEVPRAFTALQALGLVRDTYHPETADRVAYLDRRLDWDSLPRLLADPLASVQKLYDWGAEELAFPILARRLHEAVLALGLPASLERPDSSVVDPYLADSGDRQGTATRVRVPFFRAIVGDTPVELGLRVTGLPADAGKHAGLVLEPTVPSQLGASIQVGQHAVFKLRAGTDAMQRLGLVIRPGEIDVRYPLQPGQPLPSAGFGASLEYEPPQPTLLLGEPSGSRLDLRGAALGLRIDAAGGAIEVEVEVDIRELAARVASGNQDSFLSALLGGKDLEVPIPLAVTWSSRTGIHFRGASGFEVTLPQTLSLGPIAIRMLRVALRSSSDPSKPPDLRAEVGILLAGKFGPVDFAVSAIGVHLALVFAPGNAGPFDVQAGFKPPAGVGLSIDSGAVTGGGFLQFDHDQAQYVGALHLQFEEVSVNAIGILTTRLPGGQPGYSLVILVQASGFAPVQLGFGFSLTGVGGLLAVNRGVNVDLLRAGIKSRALDPILFTKDDPVPRAGEIVSALQNVFPPTPDSHVFGPMAQITWGTPALLTIEIALLLQLPAPLRLIILGRIKARLPDEDAPLVRINLDALGVVDFDRREVSVDAALYDSSLFEFALTGEMALRASWGENPQFALAVGGFHPRFLAPPGFPQLGRVTLTLASGDNPRLRMEAYLALTSNTVQFGSRLDFYVKADELSLEGMLGFDTLINLSPFGFTADIAGTLVLKWGSDVLFGVWVVMAFSGPNPWHARGRATFDLLGWKQSIEFDTTFGERVELPEPDLVDVGGLLQTEIEKPTNWSAQLPAGGQAATLSASPQDGTVLVHPGGELAVTQRIVPLDCEISTFGTSIPAKERSFSLSVLIGDGFQSTPVYDHFARGQFWRLSDDERLAAPSFDRMPAGVQAGGAYKTGEGVSADIVYETKIVALDGNGPPAPGPPPESYPLPAERLEPLAQMGAAGLAAVTRTARAKYRGEQLGLAVTDTEYVVAKSNLDEVAGIEVTGGSYSAAAEALRDYAASHPGEELQIVARYEVA